MQPYPGSVSDDGISAPIHWTGERLDSWKEIASFFRREVRTVQLWEKSEGLPVRRQTHKKLCTVYAYRRELETWWVARSTGLSVYKPVEERTGAARGKVEHARPAQNKVEHPHEHSHSERPRILLLPFDVSHAPHDREGRRQQVDRFAEELREDLVTELRGLCFDPIVLLRKAASFPETSSFAFMQSMAKEFEADFLLSGCVRYLRNQAYISVQLIRGADSVCSWSERYELALEKIIHGKSGLATRIGQALLQANPKKTTVEKQELRASNAPAYHACKLGFYFWSQRSKVALMKALGYFHHLLPARRAASLATSAVESAMRLDPRSLQVQNSLINLLINCSWDWRAAESKSRTLIDAGLMDGRTLQLYSSLMTSQGRKDEAISLALHAHRMEPLSGVISGQVAVAYFYAGEYDRALSFVRHTIEIQPQSMMSHAMLGRTEAERGNWDEAITALSRGLSVAHHSPFMLALLAYAHAGAGDDATANSMLRKLEESRSDDCFPAYDVSAVHSILNQEREALRNIRRAYDTRDMKTIFVHYDPRFARLRNACQFPQVASCG